MTTPRLSKNVVFLGIVSLLNDMSSDMVYPLIPLFLTQELHASLAMVGLIEGIAESTASLLKVFSGWLSDRWRNRKKLTVAGYGLSMIAKPLLAFAQAPWHVLAVRFSDRFGKGIRQAPRDALIAESTPPGALGHAFGFHKAMDTLGATLGPLLALALLPALDGSFRKLFLLSFVASFFAVLTLAIFVREKPDGRGAGELPKLSLKRLPRPYRFLLLGLGLFSLANFSDAFLFLRAQNLGIAPMYIPLLYALSNFCFAALASPFGKLADRVGPMTVLIGGYGVFILSRLGFAAAHDAWTMLFLFPLFGLFSAMTESLSKTAAVQISDPAMKGTMLGLMHTVVGITQLPASLIAGAAWERSGPQTPFMISAVLALIAVLVLIFAFGKTKTQSTVS